MKGLKTLVTGAGGFIGSHLVEALVRLGADVTAMTHYDARADLSNLEFVDPAIRAEIHTISGNVEDPFFTSSIVKGHELVFHLAALIPIPYSYLAPASFVRTNIEGTLNVLEACKAHGIARLINLSTSETYGTAQYTPIDERHPQQAQSPYAATKIAAEKLADSYYRSFALPVTNVRPFNTFGPRQSARAVIPTIIAQALSLKTIRLGSTSPVRDFTFVTDTVAGLICLADTSRAIGQTFNLGSGEGVSVGELAKRILNLLNIQTDVVSESVRVRPENSEVLKLICDRTQAESVTNWRPVVSLTDGLEATIEFVRQNSQLFRPDAYSR